MRPEDYENLYSVEDTLWWFRGMRRIHERLMEEEMNRPLTILDAGCGTGANINHFKSLGSHRVFAVDLSSDAMRWLRHRGLDEVAQASATELPFPEGTFDVVTSLDVLEQLTAAEDQTALAEAARVLKPGGALLIRVPAFNWLWSSSDDAIRSVHRYNLPELAAMLGEAGYEISLLSYANAFLFPVAVVWRLLKHAGIGGGSDVRPLPKGLGWLNDLFFKILASEAGWLCRGRRFPFGLSVIAWARKPV